MFIIKSNNDRFFCISKIAVSFIARYKIFKPFRTDSYNISLILTVRKLCKLMNTIWRYYKQLIFFERHYIITEQYIWQWCQTYIQFNRIMRMWWHLNCRNFIPVYHLKFIFKRRISDSFIHTFTPAFSISYCGNQRNIKMREFIIKQALFWHIQNQDDIV